MSNFVTGLVRRAAGLPQPVAIRPAVVSAQMPALAPTPPGDLESRQEIKLSPAVVLGEHGRGSDIGKPDFSAPVEPAPGSAPQRPAAPEPERQRPEKLSARTEDATLLLRPRSEPAPMPLAASQVQREDRSSSGVANEGRMPRPSPSTVLPLPTGVNLKLQAPPFSGDIPPKIARPEPAPRPDAVSPIAPTHPPLGAESITVARVQPASTAAARSGAEGAQVSRGIQVKIGKVEIRSSQPAPVVRTNRAMRTSGFDDLRLARTYLDRGTR